MSILKFIDVTFQAKDGSHRNDRVRLWVEEFVPIDPAAFQHEAGWTCYSKNKEYFVSEAGDVYRQPENVVVGFAPVLREDAEKRESEISKAMEEDEVFDPDGTPLPYGRCDTCGARCDKDGCTWERSHKIAL
jgi:hypothetical protein